MRRRAERLRGPAGQPTTWLTGAGLGLLLVLFGCVTLAGCFGPGLEPPGDRGGQPNNASTAGTGGAGVIGPGGRAGTTGGGKAGAGGSSSGPQNPPNSGGTDAGAVPMDAGVDSGQDDDDAGTTF